MVRSGKGKVRVRLELESGSGLVDVRASGLLLISAVSLLPASLSTEAARAPRPFALISPLKILFTRLIVL